MKDLPFIVNPIHRLIITIVIGVLLHIKHDEAFRAHWINSSGR